MYRAWRKWSRVADYTVLKILDLISREPMHGYGILKNLEESYGIKLSPGLMYPVLRRAVEMGLATASETSIDGRRVVVYEITPVGREFLEKRRPMLEAFERKALRIKQCRLNVLIARLRHLLENIDRVSESDLERLGKAVDRFLEEIESIRV